MKTILCTLAILCPLIAFSKEPAAEVSTSETWTSIFNGKDFDGWVVPENNTWWTISEESIICQSGPKKKGSTLWT
jgi:hypothetical protein